MTTYYWRIDTVNEFGTTTGAYWSFTTAVGSIPAVSDWGIVGMTLLVLTAGTLVYARRARNMA